MLGAIGTTLIRLLIARKKPAAMDNGGKCGALAWIECALSKPGARWRLSGFDHPVGDYHRHFQPDLRYGWHCPCWLPGSSLRKSPIVISQPVTHITTPLSEPQRRQVRRLARRTWAFFEQFAGPDDHWLPPDHFQESPRGNVAHYTTPTNIGLFLVSTLSAYDLGYMGLSELAVRLRSTFESMDKLEHYRGTC